MRMSLDPTIRMSAAAISNDIPRSPHYFLTHNRNYHHHHPKIQHYRIGAANMADGPPPAKRVKYISKDPIHMCMTDGRRFNYKETFKVLTGEKPDQECFTVHRQPFIERSKFLEAATSSRWTS